MLIGHPIGQDIWAVSGKKGLDDIFCPCLVLSFFAHFILQITKVEVIKVQ